MNDINSIKEQLKSENAEIRRISVEKIAKHQTKDSLELLFEAIGDENWRVRKTAVDSLLLFCDFDGFYKKIFTALESDDNAGKRNAAVELIIKLGDKSVEHITDFLFKANYEVKKFLIDTLGDLKNINSANVVAQFLNDSDENVRASAAETLGKIKDKSSVKSLVEILKKDDMQLRFCALEALENIGEPVVISYVIPLLDKKILRKAAFEVLGKSKNIDAVSCLIDGINDSSKASREAAIKAIISIYNTIDNKEDKNAIIALLNKVSSPELIDKLTISLNSTRVDVQTSVITLLEFLKAANTIPKLLDVLRSEELREYVFNSIISMGKGSYDIIKEEFMSRSDSDRRFLAKIMGVLKDDRYEKILIESLKDNYGHLRRAAATSLALLGKADYIKRIFPVLNDQYKDVQGAALDALTKLNGLYPEQVRAEIESNLKTEQDQLKINIISLIGRIGKKEDIKYLDMALRDGNPDVRTAAVYAIGAINVLEESKHLVLTLTDESDKVRIATAKTLGLLYSEESFKALLMALEDSNIWVKINSMRSLARLNATDAIEKIKGFLKHDNPLLVINAIESLKELKAPRLKDYLLELLNHEDTETLKTVIAILKESLDDKTIDKILSLLNSDAIDIRILVYKSLEDIKDERIVREVTPFIEKETDESIQRMAKRIFSI
jgi:HEAT repeat protein